MKILCLSITCAIVGKKKGGGIFKATLERHKVLLEIV